MTRSASPGVHVSVLSPLSPRLLVAASRRRRLAAGLGMAVTALVVGAGLAVVGSTVGPAAVVALPAALVAVWATQGRPHRALLLVVAAVPVGFVDLPVAGMELIQLVALLAVGLVVLARLLAGTTPLPWPRMAWWPLALLGLALLSTVLAPDLGLALKQVALLVAGLLLLLAVVAVVPDVATARRVLVGLALVGAGLGLHGLTGAGEFETQVGGALSVANRPTGIFTSPNQLGAMAGMTVLVGAGLALGATRRLERVVGVVAVVGGAAGLITTLSRGAWFGTGLALLAFLLLVPRARRQSLRWLLPAAVVAGLVGGILLPSASPQVQIVRDRFETLARVETSPYDDRPHIWAEAVRQTRDRPLVGQGPANFPVVSRQSVSEAVTVGAHHAHNTVLNVAAEFGLPALLVLAGFTVALLRGFVRTLRRTGHAADRALLAGVGGALIVQVGHGLVDYTLRNPVLGLMTWLVAGFIVAADEGAWR